MGETATFSVRYRPETRTACTFLVICLVLMPSWLPASTDEYVAFSLGNAQERIETLGESEWRQAAPDVFQIGGITRICGLICDQTANDVVLVGQRDAARTTLTLDDLVVALRARLVRGEWPEVSIDPRGDVGTCLVQDVHFKGGLEDTAFGYSLFEADYLLKRLALNLEAIGVKGIRTQYDLAIAQLRARAGHPTQVTCRYWFYPSLAEVVVREDAVSLKRLQTSVFAEVLEARIEGGAASNPKNMHYAPAEEFARLVSEHYGQIAIVHPSFARVQGLEEMVALAYAIERMASRPELTYWLKNYSIRKRSTPREVEVLRRTSRLTLPQAGTIAELDFVCRGGIGLRAVAIRLRAGDINALRQAVVGSRPSADSLAWTFFVQDWGIAVPAVPRIVAAEDLGELLARAEFLHVHERYGEAAEVYGKILGIAPDCAEAYAGRGRAYLEQGDTASAVLDFDQLVRMGSLLDTGHLGKGLILRSQRAYDPAIVEFTRVVDLFPENAQGYLARGITYLEKGELGPTKRDLDCALERDPAFAAAYDARGQLYIRTDQLDRAIADFGRAIGLDARADYYWNRAVAFWRKGALAAARRDFQAAAEFSSDEQASRRALLALELMRQGYGDLLPEQRSLEPPR